MAKRVEREAVDLHESSVYGDSQEDSGGEDTATEAALDRLESVTGGADDPVIAEGELSEEFEKLDASTDEEVDALRVNLLQDDELADDRDGSGKIVDDVAEERIGKLTETGPFEDEQGTASVSPGRDDTSSSLRKSRVNTDDDRTEEIVEGNVDETQDEIKSEADEDAT